MAGERLACGHFHDTRGLGIARLLTLRTKVAQWLEGETLHGTLWRAGLSRTMRPDAAVEVLA